MRGMGPSACVKRIRSLLAGLGLVFAQSPAALAAVLDTLRGRLLIRQLRIGIEVIGDEFEYVLMKRGSSSKRLGVTSAQARMV